MSGTIAVLVARTGSTRLPAKALLPILGKPMLARLAERVARSRRVGRVVIATSTLGRDDALEDLARALGIGCHRGPEENVNERICGAARAFSADTVVEILGDNPLVHASLVDAVAGLLAERGADYAANATREYPNIPDLRKFPVGVRVQAYRASCAERWREFPEPWKSPLGTNSFLFMNPDKFRCAFVEAAGPWAALDAPDMGFPVNERAQFDSVARIFADLLPLNPDFTLAEVMEWARAHPHEPAGGRP